MDNMEKMYQEVIGDSGLQQKFSDIMNEAEKAGEAETKSKLVAFAKESGFEISIEEMRAFFEIKSREINGQLSDAELDMVAGGKSAAGLVCEIITSGMTLVVGCFVISAGSGKSLTTKSCEEFFENMTQQQV